MADEEWAQWSDHEIGRMCAVDHKTVAKARSDFRGVTREILSEPRAYITRHGTPARMNVTAIGQCDRQTQVEPQTYPELRDFFAIERGILAP